MADSSALTLHKGFTGFKAWSTKLTRIPVVLSGPQPVDLAEWSSSLRKRATQPQAGHKAKCNILLSFSIPFREDPIGSIISLTLVVHELNTCENSDLVRSN